MCVCVCVYLLLLLTYINDKLYIYITCRVFDICINASIILEKTIELNLLVII